MHSKDIIYCKALSDLLPLAKKHKKTLKIIIYCTKFTNKEYNEIIQFRKKAFIPELILASNRFEIDIIFDLSKLGLLTMKDHTLTLSDIYDEVTRVTNLHYTAAKLIQKRIKQTVDKTLKNHYIRIQKKYSHNENKLANIPYLNDFEAPLFTKLITNKTKQALIIETNSTANQKLSSWMQTHQFHIDCETNAKKISQLICKKTYKVIIFSIGAICSNSLLIINQLTKLKHIPIIILARTTNKQSIPSSLQTHSTYFLTKPFSTRQLNECLLEALNPLTVPLVKFSINTKIATQQSLPYSTQNQL